MSRVIESVVPSQKSEVKEQYYRKELSCNMLFKHLEYTHSYSFSYRGYAYVKLQWQLNNLLSCGEYA